jgi:hypothetical protein
MKSTTFCNKSWSVRFLAFAFAVVMPFSCLFSQDEAKPKKMKVRLGLEYYNNFTSGPYLQASAKTKVDRSYEPVQGEQIYFYLVGESDSLLGKSITDEKGIAKLEINKDLVKMNDDIFKHTFKASIEKSERYRYSEAEIEIYEANMEVEFSGDSTYQIAVKLTAVDSAGNIMPVPDAVVKPYVQRMFSLLPVGEDEFATDESGELVLDFPNDIPGDENGMLRVIVKLPEHELYGNLVYEKDVKWGIPVTEREVITKGELWASRANAPLWLVIFVNAILVGTWGTIIYIVTQLIKISKIKSA